MPRLTPALPLPAVRVASVRDASGHAPALDASADTFAAPDRLDPAALGALAELDPGGRGGLIARILATFRVSSLRLRTQMEAARAARDPAGIRLVAHTFKSSAASVGATRLAAVAAAIEESIRIDPATLGGPALAEFDGALAQALRAVALELGDAA